jgi:hypothetical protein
VLGVHEDLGSAAITFVRVVCLDISYMATFHFCDGYAEGTAIAEFSGSLPSIHPRVIITAFYDVSEFTDITGPGIGLQQGDVFISYLADFCPSFH